MKALEHGSRHAQRRAVDGSLSEKRQYFVQNTTTTKPHRDALRKNILVALGEDLRRGEVERTHSDASAGESRWLGAFIMALGGGIAASTAAIVPPPGRLRKPLPYPEPPRPTARGSWLP